ncbi:MAG: CPBP family intramembrane metalloprotease [Verrucomicrobiaceae bacterium]|nr:CPBP family intramembrane metalloprotease [Verrucomicrobiaceae bacterium]
MNSFRTVVGVLLRYARKRAKGRAKHQKGLLNQRRGSKSASDIDWSPLGAVLAFLFCCVMHGMFIFGSHKVREATVKHEAGKLGRLILSETAIQGLRKRAEVLDQKQQALPNTRQSKAEEASLAKSKAAIEAFIGREGRFTGDRDSRDALETLYIDHFRKHGIEGFTSEKALMQTWKEEGTSPPLLTMSASFFMLWWFVALAFQGEGMELDVQRRRHPMWEWLLTHPVPPKAVFFAEMLSPLASNPMLLSAPAFWFGLYTIKYDSSTGLAAAVIAGIPIAIAAGFTAKSIEIGVMLRLSPRARGGVLGLLSWAGYVSMICAFLMLRGDQVTEWLVSALDFAFGWLNFGLPIADWTTGVFGGTLMPWAGMALTAGSALLICLAATRFSSWATEKGIGGGFGGVAEAPAALSAEPSERWLRDPLYRKELLWFWRDRSAVVQMILIPLSIAGAQVLIHFRGAMDLAGRSWQTISGAIVLFGTYILFIMGPKSLASEGPALWLPMTWPGGVERLLSSKARLWWLLSTVLVICGLAAAVLLFPSDAWKLGLVAVGWALFSGSLARKTVTLVAPTSSSGEPEPIPPGRRWAATLGTFTFAAGVLSGNWSIAIAGVIYSWMTSAAMWQNFRARMPFLFDPWSEKLPPAPTLMHAMIAISVGLEIMAIVAAILSGFGGPNQMMVGRAIGYGIVGMSVWFFMERWLSTRLVQSIDIWRWSERYPGELVLGNEKPWALGMKWCPLLLWTVGGALALAAIGVGYSELVESMPEVGSQFLEGSKHLLDHPSERFWMFLMAVCFAPFAEEYLFRGLLYRALDREWGGWQAMAASAGFFAIYHPPISWLPVALVGLFNAWLFKRSGWLVPCVFVHAIYNAIIVWQA